MPNYADFEIVIEKVSNHKTYAVNVRQPCDGKEGDATSSFDLADILPPPVLPNAENDQSLVRHFIPVKIAEKEHTLTLTDSLSEKAAREIGGRLMQSVFKDGIRELWGRCEKYKPLRIRLDLTSAPELMALPWEYMRLTDDTNFVVLDKDTTLVRYLRTSDAVRPLKVIPPLRILLAASAPQDLPQLDLNREILKIKNSLASFKEQNVEIVVLEQATIENLETALRKAKKEDKPFHIFHFIGHGAFDFDSEIPKGVLLFESEELEIEKRKSVAVGNEQLGRLLQEYRDDLRLIVLNACEGARLSVTDSYSSVATNLMRIAEIPAAIAMQFSITDAAAIVFAETFYRILAGGENLEYAVNEARRAVSNSGGAKQEWATPVLYLRAKSGQILEVNIPKPPPLEAHYQALKTVLPKCQLVFFLGLNVNAFNRSLVDSWKPEIGVIPTVPELCSYLSRQEELKSAGNSLAAIAQSMKVREMNLSDDFERIFGRLKADRPTSKFYMILAQLTEKITRQLNPDRLNKGLLFVTTTYDFALEKSFGENGVNKYHVIRYEPDEQGNCSFSHCEYENGKLNKKVLLNAANLPNKYEAWRDDSPVILKLPGEVGEDSEFAVTEDDFISFARKEPELLIPFEVLSQIRNSRHIYLGYDLQNWTLRLLRNRLCEGQSLNGRKGSYVILNNQDPNIDFWTGINIARTTLEDYVEGLKRNVLEQL